MKTRKIVDYTIVQSSGWGSLCEASQGMKMQIIDRNKLYDEILKAIEDSSETDYVLDGADEFPVDVILPSIATEKIMGIMERYGIIQPAKTNI